MKKSIIMFAPLVMAASILFAGNAVAQQQKTESFGASLAQYNGWLAFSTEADANGFIDAAGLKTATVEKAGKYYFVKNKKNAGTQCDNWGNSCE